MSHELVSILVLALIFVIATFVPINIGALAFVAAFVLGTTLLGFDQSEILAGFPAGLAVTLIGITYLFAIAQNNGTIDWLVALAVRGVRGRLVAIPWIMFTIAGVLTAAGAVSPAAVAIIAPVALGFAYRYRINPLLMGLMVIHGAQAGGFSPISIYGSITNGIVRDADLDSSPTTLFLTSLLFNLGDRADRLPAARRPVAALPPRRRPGRGRAEPYADDGSSPARPGRRAGVRARAVADCTPSATRARRRSRPAAAAPSRAPRPTRTSPRSTPSPRRTASSPWSGSSASPPAPCCSTSTSASPP